MAIHPILQLQILLQTLYPDPKLMPKTLQDPQRYINWEGIVGKLKERNNGSTLSLLFTVYNRCKNLPSVSLSETQGNWISHFIQFLRRIITDIFHLQYELGNIRTSFWISGGMAISISSMFVVDVIRDFVLAVQRHILCHNSPDLWIHVWLQR